MLFLILSVAKGWVPAAGLGIGTVVGLFGMLLTRFDSTDDELHYTPNAYVGVAVLSLLLARLVYRFSQLENLSELTHPEAGNGFKGLSAEGTLVGRLARRTFPMLNLPVSESRCPASCCNPV